MSEFAMEDYHGTPVTVELVYKSAGAFVYLEVGDDFARLTPVEAVALAKSLVATAEEAPAEGLG